MKKKELNLTPIRERLRLATPGNWQKALRIFEAGGGIIRMPTGETIQVKDARDAKFIAHCPGDVKALIEEVIQLRQELAQRRMFEYEPGYAVPVDAVGTTGDIGRSEN